MKRYEILLPLVYKNGKKIEKEKFYIANQELVKKFEATTTDTIIATGSWVYKGVLYEDKLLRIRIDTEETKKSKDFFKKYKEVLKKRFKQYDIWITSYEIEVI